MLSLGPQHSFPLSDVFRYLHPETTRDVLVQAFLDAPVFETRWRWNSTLSLAVPRTRGGRKRRAASAAHGRRRPAGIGVSRRRGVPREHSRRSSDPGSSARRADDPRLPRRGDGSRWVARRCCGGFTPATLRSSPATRPSRRSSRTRSSTPSRTRSSTTRRSRSGAAMRCRPGARVKRRSTGSARWTPRRSRACATKCGRPRATPPRLHDALMTVGFLREEELDSEALALLVALASRQRACRVPSARPALDCRRTHSRAPRRPFSGRPRAGDLRAAVAPARLVARGGRDRTAARPPVHRRTGDG